jgi:hypothetical protein
MTIRVIYYTVEDRKKYGDLQMRRQSALFEEHSFQFQDIFSFREENGKWFINPLNDHRLFANEELITQEQAISNGYTFNNSDTFFKIVHQFEYVPRSKVGIFISLFTALIIILILFSELFLVIWLPKKWSELADLSKQVTIQKSEIKIDSIRNRFRKKEKETTVTHKEAQIFLFKEMNRIADYFRNNRKYMSTEEVQAMFERLKGYEQLANLLDQGIDFDKKVKPNLARWLNEQYEVEIDEK